MCHMLHMSETLGINDARSSCVGVGGGEEDEERKRKQNHSIIFKDLST